MKRKRILYMSGISWNWIKQRPQFIAEALSVDYEVLFVDNSGQADKIKQSDCNIHFMRPWRMLLERYSLIKKLNLFLYKIYLKTIVGSYDILWISSPTEYAMAALSVKNNHAKVVYDCMDDHLAFSKASHILDRIKYIESYIYLNADIVFCSAEYLSEKIQKRYGKKNITIVNNALSVVPNYDGKTIELSDKFSDFNTSSKRLTYVGTVADWMNVDLIKRITEEISDIEIFFFGPCGDKMRKALTMPHVHLMGAIPHAQVSTVLQMSDALIMPFKLNELILSVNPVKLYEYIASGKPCIAPLYGESKQFENYAYLYSSEKECIDLLKGIGYLKAKENKEACVQYAEQNTWASRYSIIKESLNRL